MVLYYVSVVAVTVAGPSCSRYFQRPVLFAGVGANEGVLVVHQSKIKRGKKLIRRVGLCKHRDEENALTSKALRLFGDEPARESVDGICTNSWLLDISPEVDTNEEESSARRELFRFTRDRRERDVLPSLRCPLDTEGRRSELLRARAGPPASATTRAGDSALTMVVVVA